MKTREQIHNELYECIKQKVDELNTVTGLSVSSLTVEMLDVRTINDNSTKYTPGRVRVTYE